MLNYVLAALIAQGFVLVLAVYKYQLNYKYTNLVLLLYFLLNSYFLDLYYLD